MIFHLNPETATFSGTIWIGVTSAMLIGLVCAEAGDTSDITANPRRAARAAELNALDFFIPSLQRIQESRITCHMIRFPMTVRQG